MKAYPYLHFVKVAVIGAGAAGFFTAIWVKENYPKAEVEILERTDSVLSKVKVSGGGRCNVTNGCSSIAELSKAYPRGGKKLKKAFNEWNTVDTRKWFEDQRVPLKTEADGRVFPVSDSSQSIVDCLENACRKNGIPVKTKHSVFKIKPLNPGFELAFLRDNPKPKRYDKVILAAGGAPKARDWQWLKDLGQPVVDPIPSLFTFNMPKEDIRALMGVVAPHALTSIQGSKLKNEGPLLVTHWGMSGPAILKLSAFGARELAEKNYDFKLQVNWTGEARFDAIGEVLQGIIQDHPKKQISNVRAFDLPQRLWDFLIQKADLPLDKPWGELGKKGVNKFCHILANDVYEVKGKTTFKEEFVTSGGVSLEGVDFNAMQSKVLPGLYFAGEVMDIDGITGGYNFQSAWTTAYIAAKLRD